jgi:cytochrome c peroxidase
MLSKARWVLGGAAFAAACAAVVAVPHADATTSRHEALVELGRRLFMDPTVSRLGRNSCASCHDPERAFSDPRTRSPDDAGPTKRHSQTLLDLAGEGFHWDGEFRTVRELLVARVAPPEAANEAALARFDDRVAAARRERDEGTAGGPPSAVPGTPTDPPPSSYGGTGPTEAPVTPVADRLAEDSRYAESFKAAFGDAHATTARVLDAMDAYCASIRSTANAFDRFLAGDDAALSAPALRGLALFEGRAGCAQCHLTRGSGVRAPLTDGKFHDTGVAYHGVPVPGAPRGGKPALDVGRGGVTFRPVELAKFKTPTLRDVGRRGPYMHDGSFASLEDVVRYYSVGGTLNPNLDAAIRPLDLSDAEVADLVALLKSFTGEGRAALGFPARHAAPLKVRIVDLAGRPLPSLTIDVRPAGDRLDGDDTEIVASSVMSGDDGTVSIDRPLSTHVALSSPDYELGLSRPIPDSCEAQTLIATPRDTISLRVRRTTNAPPLPATITVIPSDRGAAMGNCGPAPVATLTKLRSLSADEALYAGKAPAGQTTRRCTLVVDGGRMQIVADVDLSGGASETIQLVPPRTKRFPPRVAPPPKSGTNDPPNGPTEPVADRSDRDDHERDVGERR